MKRNELFGFEKQIAIILLQCKKCYAENTNFVIVSIKMFQNFNLQDTQMDQMLRFEQ
jgi:hypothetical protein